MAKDPAFASDALRERIEVAYMAATGSDTPHGALRWAAQSIGVGGSTIGRWVAPEGSPDYGYPSKRSRMSITLLERVVRLTYGEAAIIRASQVRQTYLRQKTA